MILRIGVMPKKEIESRVLAIANDLYVPKDSEPSVWFTSLGAVDRAVSGLNATIHKILREEGR